MTKSRNFSKFGIYKLSFIQFCHDINLEDLETVFIYYDELKKSKEVESDYPVKIPDGLR
jgi:hypothetical protein